MKFQKTPLILLFGAMVLGGFVYFSELKKQPPTTEAQSESNPVFAFKEEDVQAFTIQTSKQKFSFEKIPATVPANQKGVTNSNFWQMTAPEKTTADAGAVAFLLNLMATSRSDRTLPTPVDHKSEFGLDQPFATVEVKLANQQTHRLLLGKPNFNRSFLYALVDPAAKPTQDLAVLLVPIEFQNAVDRPLAEWKQLKEKPKASPSPNSTTSPDPAISPTSSPTPTTSPDASPTSSPSPTNSPSPN
jgi:cell division septation protein DedD